MASIVKDPGGKRIQWCVSGGRRTLRLGNVSLRQAEAVKVRIEQVLAAQSTGVLDTQAAAWLESLPDEMHGKLSRLGLIRPRDRHVATLEQLLENFFATIHVKPGTRRTYEQTKTSLESYFGQSRSLVSISTLDCDHWRQSMRDEDLADATVAKRVKTARQIFRQAVKWKLLAENPLLDVKAGSTTNRARQVFITREMIAKVLDACGDHEWRVIVSMARFGGIRVPSELLPLRWSDVNFEAGTIHIRSPKTEAYRGGDERIIPMFPELRVVLLEAFERAEAGAEHVITRYRLNSTNLRTQMHRIIRRAGLVPWMKPFHNLRSSRQTELTEEFPVQCVCRWLGNSVTVARESYLQVTDAHLARAISGTSCGTVGHVAAGAGVGGSGAGAGAGPATGQRAANGASVAA